MTSGGTLLPTNNSISDTSCSYLSFCLSETTASCSLGASPGAFIVHGRLLDSGQQFDCLKRGVKSAIVVRPYFCLPTQRLKEGASS